MEEPSLICAGPRNAFSCETYLSRDVERRFVVENAGKFHCILSEIVSCQILVVFE